MELRIDAQRPALRIVTGIYVRAKSDDGHWKSVDIADLDAASLLLWLRSRGGHNPLAENTVGVLLGHEGNIAQE